MEAIETWAPIVLAASALAVTLALMTQWLRRRLRQSPPTLVVYDPEPPFALDPPDFRSYGL